MMKKAKKPLGKVKVTTPVGAVLVYEPTVEVVRNEGDDAKWFPLVRGQTYTMREVRFIGKHLCLMLSEVKNPKSPNGQEYCYFAADFKYVRPMQWQTSTCHFSLAFH